MSLYHIGLMGVPTDAVRDALQAMLMRNLTELGLDREVVLTMPDRPFDPPRDLASVAVYFGAAGAPDESARLIDLMHRGVAILPVVSAPNRVSAEIPECLRPINALSLDASDLQQERLAAASLEVLGLLPRQRRVFISYRRTESREVALQLFESLSARHFEVFLDTHSVDYGEDFQEALWHRLSDCDALVMLDTPGYFDGQWTRKEFGKALAKDLIPVRLAWPGVARHPSSLSGLSMEFTPADFDAAGTRLIDETLNRCGLLIEQARSKGLALRTVTMVSTLTWSAQKVGGRFLSLGPKRTALIEVLGKDRTNTHRVLVFPSVGVPTAEHLHLVSELEGNSNSRAVLYDDMGIDSRWEAHLEWLGLHVKTAHWLKLSGARWRLSTWADDVS